MLRTALAAAALACLATAASAQDFHLVRWKKSGRCDVITTLPLFGDHWVELGLYPTRRQAEAALRTSRRVRECRPAPRVKDDEQ